MTTTLEEYKKTLFTYFITDCAVRNKDRFSFIVDRWYSDKEVEEEEGNGWSPAFRPKRLVTFFRQDPIGDQWGATDFSNWTHVRCGVADKPKSQYIAIELEEDRVYVIGSGEDFFDTPLTKSLPNNPNRGGIRKIKTINGYAYVCGGGRSLGKRMGKGKWESYTHLLEPHPEAGRGGFDDFDGFSETDIYAAGGKGDVWHFDGKQWRQIAFPTNAWVQTVCCGADGNVYISCYEGLTFMGRGDTWKKIHDGGVYLGWRDMVWYEDRAWCASENGLWTIHNNKVETVRDLPSEISVCSGNLHANDGVLLMAGMGGAAFRENGQWNSIFVRARMEKLLRERAS